MQWQLILDSLPLYVEGIRTTLVLLAISLLSSFVLAVPLAVARVSANPLLSKSVWLYTYVLRGTPLLVQLFIIYHGLAQFEAVRESVAWVLLNKDHIRGRWLLFIRQKGMALGLSILLTFLVLQDLMWKDLLS